MGNHEWCPNCEMDDFHDGKECDPAKVLARIQREIKNKEIKDECIKRMKKKLDKVGVKYEINDRVGRAEFYWYDFKGE